MAEGMKLPERRRTIARMVSRHMNTCDQASSKVAPKLLKVAPKLSEGCRRVARGILHSAEFQGILAESHSFVRFGAILGERGQVRPSVAAVGHGWANLGLK